MLTDFHGKRLTQKNWDFQLTQFSIIFRDSTNPRTNPWNFRDFFLRIGGFENLSFFESVILKFPWKSVNNFNEARMGRNFDDYPGLQQKSMCV